MDKRVIYCPVCLKTNKNVVMIEQHDTLICPECKTSFHIKGKIPLGRYIEEWTKNAEDLFPLLRPEIYLPDLPVPQLFFLYEDCYHTLLIGKYNAAIVLMGLLLEAIMKERIRLHLGKDFFGPYGACLRIIAERKLMDAADIAFLRRFKNRVRNPYAHVDESQVLQGIFVKAWEIPLETVLSPAKFEETMKEIQKGKRKPKLIPATNPIVRPVVKREYDRNVAISLFNQVYDFLICAHMKYFKQKHYDEYFQKFGKQNHS
jgi:hypothetical protein